MKPIQILLAACLLLNSCKPSLPKRTADINAYSALAERREKAKVDGDSAGYQIAANEADKLAAKIREYADSAESLALAKADSDANMRARLGRLAEAEKEREILLKGR